MPTITGRSNTGLLGAILTAGRAMVFLGTWWASTRILSLGVVRCASRRSQVLLLDPVGVEFSRALAHGLQDFLERRRVALDPAQRVDAPDHEGPQIGADEAALLELGHDRRDAFVEVHQHAGVLLVDLDRRGQRVFGKLRKAPDDGSVGAAGELAVLLVAHPQGDE